MKRNWRVRGRTLMFAVAAMVAASPAMADKPSWAGNGNNDERRQSDDRGNGRERERDRREERGRDEHRERRESRFDDRRRMAVRDYYAKEYRRGRCPPGLARKHDGCMPPGHARRWNVGQPLPRDVVRYDLPHSLVVQIGVPPAGYRYVRVASDILMIAAGTNMVVDAVNDLGQR